MIKRLIKWILKILAAVASLGAVALITLFAFLWHEHRTEIILPAPTGHFAVGRTMYTWVNNAETDELAPSHGSSERSWFGSGIRRLYRLPERRNICLLRGGWPWPSIQAFS